MHLGRRTAEGGCPYMSCGRTLRLGDQSDWDGRGSEYGRGAGVVAASGDVHHGDVYVSCGAVAVDAVDEDLQEPYDGDRGCAGRRIKRMWDGGRAVINGDGDNGRAAGDLAV